MSKLFEVSERVMKMDAATWQRHANPWSVYTRMTILPLLALAVFSRVWLGAWAWVAVALVLLWVWVNPRLFSVPRHLDNWASRGVLGEQVLLRRPDDLPHHHKRWAIGLGTASIPGLALMVWALWQLDALLVVAAVFLAMGPKLWFLDRMNWLYADWCRANGKDLGDV